MDCILMNERYSICRAVFQAGFQSRQSFSNGSDSFAPLADRARMRCA
jgi:hypothetical protein